MKREDIIRRAFRGTGVGIDIEGKMIAHIQFPGFETYEPPTKDESIWKNIIINAALLGPLPPGWEETHTQEGQKYYMNHITKSTQWEDPRITVSQLPLHQNNQHVAQISGGPGGSLPHGWEQGTTPEGEIYYIDHSTHRTQWHAPRIPQSQQPNIPQRINNQGTSQQRLLQLQREKKAVLVRF